MPFAVKVNWKGMLGSWMRQAMRSVAWLMS